MKSELHELVRKPSKRPSSKRTSPTPPLGTSRTSRNPRGSHIGGQPKVRKLSPYPQSSVALVARFAIDSSTAAFFHGQPTLVNHSRKVAPDRPFADGRDLGRYLRRGHLATSAAAAFSTSAAVLSRLRTKTAPAALPDPASAAESGVGTNAWNESPSDILGKRPV